MLGEQGVRGLCPAYPYSLLKPTNRGTSEVYKDRGGSKKDKTMEVQFGNRGPVRGRLEEAESREADVTQTKTKGLNGDLIHSKM